MDVSAPQRSLALGTEGDVLVELAGVQDARSGRQLAERTGRSHVAVSRALRFLSEQGLVTAEAHPPAILYTLNREHISAPIVVAMAGLRGELIRRLREQLAGWPLAPAQASLFGSTARRDGDASSDVDLLVLRPDAVEPDEPQWERQLSELADAVLRWTGNHAQILELSASEFDALSAQAHPTIANIRHDAIHLAGTRLTRRALGQGAQ